VIREGGSIIFAARTIPGVLSRGSWEIDFGLTKVKNVSARETEINVLDCSGKEFCQHTLFGLTGLLFGETTVYQEHFSIKVVEI
jgi:hypothetical protein